MIQFRLHALTLIIAACQYHASHAITENEIVNFGTTGMPERNTGLVGWVTVTKHGDGTKWVCITFLRFLQYNIGGWPLVTWRNIRHLCQASRSILYTSLLRRNLRSLYCVDWSDLGLVMSCLRDIYALLEVCWCCLVYWW